MASPIAPKVVERFSEQEWVPPWIRYQHITRYQWAATVTDAVRGKHVLDAACGSGYGTKILRDAGAARVVGFDLEAAAIEDATLKYGDGFSVGDVTNLPVATEAYDTYVSFETIEHIPEEQAYLREAVRVLRPGGMFFCSTPNRAVTNPGTQISQKPFNPHHIREYTIEEFRAVLAPYFEIIDMYSQAHYGRTYAAFLDTIGRAMPMLAVRTHQFRKLLGMPLCRMDQHYPQMFDEKTAPEYVIAVCRKRG
ncbi:MAG TPA: methyltransferase domain-containing protein [Gemmataceae bacterium]|nr:methyltransferase domain-containing protein [Gemmataceae bacterium]